MPLRNLAWLLIVPALVALGLAVSYSAPAPDNDYKRVRKVVDVMAEVDANFYRKLSDEEWKKFTENMINGGLHELDPHSQYLNATNSRSSSPTARGATAGSASYSTSTPPRSSSRSVRWLPARRLTRPGSSRATSS